MRHAQAFDPKEVYFRQSVLASAKIMTQVALVYFVVVIAFLASRLGPDMPPLMLLQKLTYLVAMGGLCLALTRNRIACTHAYTTVSLLLGMCATTVMVSVAYGVTDNLTSNFSIMLLATSLLSLSLARSLGYWVILWMCWLGLHYGLSNEHLGAEAVALLGVQLVSLAISRIRINSTLATFQMRQKEISQSRELEKALKEAQQAREFLDRQVEERTRQLRLAYEDLQLSTRQREEMQRASEELQAQLIQAQKMESLGRLAGGVAHDFNNLLTVILGNLELARTFGPQEDTSDLLEQADMAARRAAEVSSQLLAFSRKQVLQLAPLELTEVTQEAARLLQRLLGEDILLSVVVPGRPLKIQGDRAQLQQVLMNLGVNARDAMPRGGRLTIQLSVCQRKGLECARMQVQDTGKGISPEDHCHIWEPFFTTKPFGEGTGLGLSTVHGIISQHHGEIEVESAPGEGTTFTLYFPLTQEGPQGPIPPAPLLGEVCGEARVLLVEDDAQVRGLALRVLKLAGYQVSTAESGSEALETYDPGCDVLVTDIVMPGMDGASLASQLKEKNPDLKVLFVSGYSDDRLEAFGIESENCNFLAKPYSPWELCRRVQSMSRKL